MSAQALWPYYWILPVSGLAGVGLGLRYRVPIAVIASVLFAALASYVAWAEGRGWLGISAAAATTLIALQAGYFAGALMVQR